MGKIITETERALFAELAVSIARFAAKSAEENGLFYHRFMSTFEYTTGFLTDYGFAHGEDREGNPVDDTVLIRPYKGSDIRQTAIANDRLSKADLISAIVCFLDLLSHHFDTQTGLVSRAPFTPEPEFRTLMIAFSNTHFADRLPSGKFLWSSDIDPYFWVNHVRPTSDISCVENDATVQQETKYRAVYIEKVATERPCEVDDIARAEYKLNGDKPRAAKIAVRTHMLCGTWMHGERRANGPGYDFLTDLIEQKISHQIEWEETNDHDWKQQYYTKQLYRELTSAYHVLLLRVQHGRYFDTAGIAPLEKLASIKVSVDALEKVSADTNGEQSDFLYRSVSKVGPLTRVTAPAEFSKSDLNTLLFEYLACADVCDNDELIKDHFKIKPYDRRSQLLAALGYATLSDGVFTWRASTRAKIKQLGLGSLTEEIRDARLLEIAKDIVEREWEAITAQLNDFLDKCPDSKLDLIGQKAGNNAYVHPVGPYPIRHTFKNFWENGGFRDYMFGLNNQDDQRPILFQEHDITQACLEYLNTLVKGKSGQIS